MYLTQTAIFSTLLFSSSHITKNSTEKLSIEYIHLKAKAVPQHAMKALAGRGGIAAITS
jgi:hypothetical protein